VTVTADAVVVGAGVIGCSTAFELARTGRRVIVVDRLGGPGQGSTSASSAVVRYNYSTAAGVAASWEAKHCWEKWADHLGGAHDGPLARFRRTGMVILDVDIAPRARFLRLFDEAAIPYEEWDAATLTERLPGIDVGRYWPPKRLDDEAFWADVSQQVGAVFTPDAGFIDDPQLAAINLADAAQRQGVDFRFHQQVTAVRRDGERVAGVELADGSCIDAPVVVNIAGPWSSAFNRLAGVGADFTVSTRPMRQEVHHVTAPAGFNNGDALGPTIADLDLGTYIRASAGDGMLIGGTEPECDPLQWIDDPDEANPNPTVPVFEAQVTRAARRFPDLQVPAAPRGIAGVYDVTDDWTPIYDRTELDGFYVAIGTSGNQFKNAPVSGRFMAAIITAVEAGHDHDVQPVQYVGEHTGMTVDLGAFSRKRPVNEESSGTVMG
jgi:glycine/D-amino acid oxidase-like deaminating enzyme